MHIDPADMDLLKKILRVFLPAGRRVFAFGSRVTGVHLKRYSDLDLCVKGEQLTSRELGDLADALMNSNLTMRVDVIDWAATDEKFRKIIEPQFEEIQY